MCKNGQIISNLLFCPAGQWILKTIIYIFFKYSKRNLWFSAPLLQLHLLFFLLLFILYFLLELQRRKRKSRAFLWYACLAWGKSISRHEKSNCWELVTDCRETKTILQHCLLYECCRFVLSSSQLRTRSQSSCRLDFHLTWIYLYFYLCCALHQTNNLKVLECIKTWVVLHFKKSV